MPTDPPPPLRVLFATAELSPLARVGGLAEASAGLTAALAAAGVAVDIVLPDYDRAGIEGETVEELILPDFAGAARARTGLDSTGRRVTLVDAPRLARSHPYLDPANGEGWADNDHRFLGFSAAVAELTRRRQPDLLHLNDWHTRRPSGFLKRRHRRSSRSTRSLTKARHPICG